MKRFLFKLKILFATLTTLLLLPTAAMNQNDSGLNRPDDPVILKGADILQLTGILPSDLVAFSYKGGEWIQIPVQVDEMKTVSYGKEIYNNVVGYTSSDGYTIGRYLKSTHSNFKKLVYCDSGTFTGADTNPYIDEDDEIVFMAKDAGASKTAAGVSFPAIPVMPFAIEVKVTDPLDEGKEGYVYLFKQTGGLDPAAGKKYVDYTFNLLSGEYKANYNILDATNPEDSSVVTPYYEYHFKDRWADDGLKIKVGNSTGVNILDRNKVSVMPGYGARNEDTFDGVYAKVKINSDKSLSADKSNSNSSEGAFIANINGPVRAIRSYVGANSGPLTQRNYFAYEKRLDSQTILRVHSMPSLMSFFDYNDNAIGMKYYNNLNTGGVIIDGEPDTMNSGKITTEFVTGPQGSMVISSLYSTDVTVTEETPGEGEITFSSYYFDKMEPNPRHGSYTNMNKEEQFTGDSKAIGSSGVQIMGDVSKYMSKMVSVALGSATQADADKYALPNTDPVKSSNYSNLQYTKILNFKAPEAVYDEAVDDTGKAEHPLATETNFIIDEAAEKYYVIYNKNGADIGTPPVDDIGYVNGMAVTPKPNSDLVRASYTFKGWALTPDGKTPVTNYIIQGSDITLYAIWELTPAFVDLLTYSVGGENIFSDDFSNYGENASITVNKDDSAKWSEQAAVTNNGGYNKVKNNEYVIQSRISGTDTSAGRLTYFLDNSIVSEKKIITYSYRMKTGSIGTARASLRYNKTNIPLIKHTNGVVAAATGTGVTSVDYVPGTIYDAGLGEYVECYIIVNLNTKTYSAYANGTALIEGQSFTYDYANIPLAISFDAANHPADSEARNWAAIDNVKLAYGGIGVTKCEFFESKNNVTDFSSNTLKLKRTIINETADTIPLSFIIIEYNQELEINNVKILKDSIDSLKLRITEKEFDIDPEAQSIKVFMWSGADDAMTLIPVSLPDGIERSAGN